MAVTQQAFGLEGVEYNLRSWEMLGSVDRATSVVLLTRQGGAAYRQRPAAAQHRPRTGDDAWSTIFLWGAEYLNWNVRWILAIKAAASCGSLSSVARATFMRLPTCLPYAS
jgi:hypothetical protein